MFITFEGGEGTGKSTQVRRLAEFLQSKGHEVLLTREPGGTPGAESVRGLLVNGDVNTWSAQAEALLNNAARDSHLHTVIRPALAAGKTVLCDRFMDSTRVYQGIAGQCAMDLIDVLETHVVGASRPDLTFVFDLDPRVGLHRAKTRGPGLEDRYERKGLAFHDAIRQGFLAVAAQNAGRCVLVDASAPEDHVLEKLLLEIKERGLG